MSKKQTSFDYPVKGQKEATDMQYLLLIYTNENQFEALGEGEKKRITGEYMELASSMRANGQYVGGNRLDLTSKATTVRVRDGKKLVTDGPFAETKEQLGGYFLVEANDLDEAIGLARKIPAARWGSVEVRPIVPVPVPVTANV
jgi:hypothetical protein